jgi:hypothetical protein
MEVANGSEVIDSIAIVLVLEFGGFQNNYP